MVHPRERSSTEPHRKGLYLFAAMVRSPSTKRFIIFFRSEVTNILQWAEALRRRIFRTGTRTTRTRHSCARGFPYALITVLTSFHHFPQHRNMYTSHPLSPPHVP